MLKRCQVLLESWQEEYLKNTAERYDQSFSEVLRIFLSQGFLFIIPRLHPEFKTAITGKEIKKMTIKVGSPSTSIEDRHRLISRLYFEARKAVEYRMEKVKKQKNNKR